MTVECKVEGRMEELPLRSIDLGDRHRQTYSNIQGLADSIRENGLIHPIAVWERGENDYLLLAGGRRYTAHILLGTPTIKARIYERELSEIEILNIELIENLDRENLTWQEETKLKKSIHDLRKAQYGDAHTIRETAEELGESRSLLTEDIKLAVALEGNDELAKAPDKSSAKRLMKRIEQLAQREESFKRAKETKPATVADKIKKSLIASYYHGDFFKHAEKLPREHFNFIEVDPPYGIDLQATRKNQTDRGSLRDYTEVAPKDYLAFLQRTVEMCYKLAANGSWTIFWHALQWSTEVLTILKSTGYKVFHVPAIWVKNRPGQTWKPEFILGSTYEPFYYCRKGDAVFHSVLPARGNVLHYSQVHQDKKIHPTERPIEMMTELVLLFSPPKGRVLVPFAGSGNTLLACNNTGRSCLGYDLNEAYLHAFANRVEQGTIGDYHSYPKP